MADHIIEVRIDDKIATVVGDPLYVCGNSDYIVKFAFDAEWADHAMKTARFIKSNKEYIDVVFNGNECPMPIIADTPHVRIGVFAGNLCTTTAAIVNAQRSILCGTGVPAEQPEPNVYTQIMERIDGLGVPDLNRRVDALQSNAVIAQHVRGDMLHIEDAAAWQAEKVVTHIEPKQEGSGDPSPDNIRPISGWTEAKVNVSGKNMLPNNGKSETVSGVTFTVNADGTVTANGTATETIFYTICVGAGEKLPKGVQLYVCGAPAFNGRVGIVDAYNGVFASYDNPVSFVLTNNARVDAAIRINSGVVCNNLVFKPMITTDAGATYGSYTPYQQGQNLTAQFSQTVYGGEFDWKTGKLTETHTLLTINGSEEYWADYPAIQGFSLLVPSMKKSNAAIGVASHLPVHVGQAVYGVTIGMGNNQYLYFHYVKDQWGVSTVNDLKAYLAENPVQIVIPKKTPEEIQLTSQQMPELLKGVNNVWCDTGETEMVYIADNQLYIDQKIGASTAALNALMEGINNA